MYLGKLACWLIGLFNINGKKINLFKLNGLKKIIWFN